MCACRGACGESVSVVACPFLLFGISGFDLVGRCTRGMIGASQSKKALWIFQSAFEILFNKICPRVQFVLNQTIIETQTILLCQ